MMEEIWTPPARPAAADERINCWLADAVERHATKVSGMRGILKRASATCHPESEPQKKIALDTEQDSTPNPSVSHGGSSAPGTRPSITTSTDQNTGTGDVTREVTAGPALDVTRTGSENHIGGDVAMMGDGAVGDTGARRGQKAGEESQRMENHVKSTMRKRTSLSNTFQAESRRKRRCRSTQLQLPHKRHWTDTAKRQ